MESAAIHGFQPSDRTFEVVAEDLTWRWGYGDHELVWEGSMRASLSTIQGGRWKMDRLEVVVALWRAGVEVAGPWGVPDEALRLLEVSRPISHRRS
jgi:hypothetical protein